MPKKESNLEELKREYKNLQEKYNLPNFELINKEFSIEKISENETELLTKEIRRFIADKVFNYLRFIETILNPVNAPIFIFSIMKSLNQDDKSKLTNVYEKLSLIDLELIKLDVETTEKKDGEFIKRVFDTWQEIKKELISVLDKLKYIKEENTEEKSKSKYFG
jgi:hypothetical protein